MSRPIVINIASGHYAGAEQISESIKEKLQGIFKHEIKMINLNERAKSPKQYSDKDYDFNKIIKEIECLPSTSGLVIVLVYGCYSIYDAKLNELSSLKVYVDSDGDKRLINMLNQESVNASEELAACITHYMDRLRPEMITYVEPSKAHADIILPSMNDNLGTAIIVDGIVKVVEQHQGGELKESPTLFPHLDFNIERLEMESERYYDLS
ncbi:PRK domain-containing protein [Kluyveromyces marxianus]